MNSQLPGRIRATPAGESLASTGQAAAIVDVVIPTRDRPTKLRKCLTALAAAREKTRFRAYVVDSSTTEESRRAVEEVCGSFSFASLHRHTRSGLAAARNECTRAGQAPLLISVDDDVYVEPDAIDKLLQRYATAEGWRIVAGSVSWGSEGSRAIRMRRIGYGVAEPDERRADFYVTALILYPRELARQYGFNERIASSDDRFIGALWRSKGVSLLWEPDAFAHHDDEHNAGLQAASHHDSHIYTNLFDALLVRRSLSWAMSFEFLGFLAGAKLHFRRPNSAAQYCRAWLRGNVRFIRDRKWLTAIAGEKVSGSPPEVPQA